MKKLYFILLILLMGCFNDDTQILETSEAIHNTSQITNQLKSITLHNAAFDNRIDNTSCFSLVFPYQININSTSHTISSIEDISTINQDDILEVVYPVTAVFYNYEQHQALNQSDLNNLKNSCQLDFNIQSNNCLNITYPITIKEFNELSGNFKTLNFNHDSEVFTYLENLHDSDFYEIQFPIFLSDVESNTFEIDNDTDFIEAYINTLQNCQ